MPLEEQSMHFTALSIPSLGQFEWVVDTMGLLGSPASFQQLVKLAMAGLVNIIVYIDDFLVDSKAHEDHLNQQDKPFSRLRNVG